MTVTMEKYNQLLEQFVNISEKSIDSITLKKLKDHYRDNVHSRRKLETIDNIDILLRILDKRGVIQYNNITELKYIGREFIKEESIEQLVANYDKWLEENYFKISNVYSCGKLNESFNKNKSNVTEQKPVETSDLYNENISIMESKENCKESLLSDELDVNINTTNLVNNNAISALACNWKFFYWKNINSVAVLATILIILVGVIGILVNVSYQSAASKPSTYPVNKTVGGQVQSTMPYNVHSQAFFSQTAFAFNQSQFSTTNPPVLTAINSDVEKQLQNLIIRKVAERIGSKWADTCRYLNIRESVIEELERKYYKETQSREKMFTEAMKIYFSESPSNWKKELVKALRNSGRTDLKEMVEEILY